MKGYRRFARWPQRPLTLADGERILWHIMDHFLEMADGQIPLNEIQIYLSAQRDVHRLIEEIQLAQ